MPTANASSASSDRLSYGDGTTTTVAASSACSRSWSGQAAGEADERILRQRHQLHAHQHERRVAAVLDVGAEVLDQLLAALARIDAAAVEHERPVQAMAAAEHRAAAARGAAGSWADSSAARRVAVVVIVLGRVAILARRSCACGRSTPQPTVSSSTRADREVRRQEAALDLGVVGDAGRRARTPPCRCPRRIAGSSCAVGTRMLLCGATAHAEHRRRVEIGEEDQDVVLLLVALEVLEQRRAPRPLLPQPLASRPRGVCSLLKIHSE